MKRRMEHLPVTPLKLNMKTDNSISTLEKRMNMVTQFAFKMSDGTKDINNAIGRMIEHPDELPRQFTIDDTRPVKMVWAIYSPDREEWLDNNGHYMIVQQTITEYSIIGRKEKELLKHTIPFFETMDEMFNAYELWEQRHTGNIK